MSREIKFRAWNLTYKWMEDSFFISSGGVAYDVPSRTFDTPNTEIEEVPDYVVMQFTGLRDANGVEIYEGDIVKYKHADINRGIIMFNTDNFAGLPAFHVCSKDGESVGYYYGVVADDSYIVIGNIYEHPHLLDDSK